MNNDRRMTVLRAVVEDYIRTQEPVGSSALAKRHGLSVSSATVRNDMAALEDEGYLIQPYTSAGRIPTEKGYRFFVNRLASAAYLSEPQRLAVKEFLSGSVNLDDALRRASKLLAQITGQVAVVTSPSLARSALRRLEIVPLNIDSCLAVVITDTGRVEQRTVINAYPIDFSQLAFVAGTINSQCMSMNLSDVSAFIEKLDIPVSQTGYDCPMNALANIFRDIASRERTDSFYVSGTSHLAHCESMNHDDMTSLFDALEEQIVIMRLMNSLSGVSSEENVSKSDVGVAIGSETNNPALKNASFVSGGYGSENQTGKEGVPLAFVGSVGPTHMDYATTIASVRVVASYLSRYIAAERNPHFQYRSITSRKEDIPLTG